MAEEYLNKISKKSKDEHERNNEADFRDRWRKQLSVVVQPCNSRVILRSCQNCLSATSITLHMIETFNILSIDCYCFA